MTKKDYPLFERISIECNSFCNRSCSFCTRTYDNREKKRLSSSLIYKTLNELFEINYTGLIAFHFYNEVFTDSRIFEFFEKCKELNLNNYIVTNGDFLTKDNIAKLSSYNIKEFTLSLYDCEDRNDFELKSKKYIFDFQLDQYDWDLIILYGGDGFTNRAGNVNYVEEKLALPIKAACSKIVKKIDVRYDGEVVMCCLDYYGQHSIGNISKTNIIDIWYGEKKRQQLQELANGNRYKFKLCSKCSDYMIDIKE